MTETMHVYTTVDSMSGNLEGSHLHNRTEECQNTTGKCHYLTGVSHNVTGSYHNVTGKYHNTTFSNSIWEKSSEERAVSLLVIGIIIILANILTLIVAHKLVKQGQKLTNLFIFALAWTDLLVAILILPLSIAGHFGAFIGKYTIICKISFLITNTLTQMSVYLIAAMSIERYMAFVHPLVHKVKFTVTKAKWTIIMIFASGFIGSILPIVGIGELENNGYVCMIKWDSESLVGKIMTYLLAGTGIGMITIVWILNLLVIYHLNFKKSKTFNQTNQNTRNHLETETTQKSAPRKKKALTSRILKWRLKGSAKIESKSRKNHKSEIRFAQITIVLAFFFSVCWLPYCIRAIMVQSGLPQKRFIDFIVIRLAACNSMINPIIYGALKAGYRRGYLYLVRLAMHYVLCKQTQRPCERSFLQHGTAASYQQQICYSAGQTPQLLHFSHGEYLQTGRSTSGSSLDSINTRQNSNAIRNSPSENSPSFNRLR